MTDLLRATGPGRHGATSIRQPADRRRQPGDDRLAPVVRVVAHLCRAAANRPHERAERQELPVREEGAPRVEPVARQARRPARVGRRPFRDDRLVGQAEGDVGVERLDLRPLDTRRVELHGRRQAVLLAGLAVHDDGGHAFAEPPRQTLGADVLRRRDRPAGGAPGAARAHGAFAQGPVVLAPLGGVAVAFRYVVLDAELHAATVGPRLHGESNALLRLLAEPARLQQGNLGPATPATDRARPQIRDRRLRDPPRVAVVLQVQRIELRVERRRRNPPVLVRLEQPRRPAPPAHRRGRLDPPPTLAPHRLELRVGRIPRRQRPARRRQHPPSPRPQVPRGVRARRGRLRVG